jgi:hypothetical protein
VQNLGYHYLDKERDDGKEEWLTADSDNDLARIHNAIDREIRRRTFWSCFILNQYTACGEDRVDFMNVDYIATQLPCSDKAFHKGLKVKTRLLGESDDKYRERRRANETRQTYNRILASSRKEHDDVRWEEGKDEAELSLYIQTVHHFSLSLSWSVGKGRRYVQREVSTANNS